MLLIMASGKEILGRIQVSSYEEDDCYTICVADDGWGYLNDTPESVPAREILEKINDTLRHQTGGRAEYLNIPEEGTVISIIIPKEPDGE